MNEPSSDPNAFEGAEAHLEAGLADTTTLAEIATLVVPSLADCCAIHLASEERGMELVALVHRDPGRVAEIETLTRRWPIGRGSIRGAAAVAQLGEPLILPRISQSLLWAYAVDEDHGRALQDLGLTSALVVPIVGPNRSAGTITLLTMTSQREYGKPELPLARRLGQHAASLLANPTA